MADETPPTGFFSKPPPPAPSMTVAPLPAPVAAARPWVRYFARMLDIVICGMVLGIALGALAPNALNKSKALLGFLVLFLWILVETALLASWGTTPGKWMLSTKVRTARGPKLDGWAALSRSFDVWLRGLGIGIPFISLFTMAKAYNRLKANGETLWDANGELVVSHERLRAGRLVLAVLVVLAWVGLAWLGAKS